MDFGRRVQTGSTELVGSNGEPQNYPDRAELGTGRGESRVDTMEAALFERFFHVSPDGIVLLDANDCVLKASPAFSRLFGYSLAEMLGRPINDLIVSPDFRDQASEISQRALSNEVVLHEALRCCKNGDLVYVEIYGTPISVNDRQIGIYAIYRDVTARRLVEDQLQQSEERYRSIVETMEDGYFEIDLTGDLVFFNRSLARMLGRPETELMGLNNRQYMDEETARRVYQKFNQVMTTGKANPGFSWQLTRPDGSISHMETSVVLIQSQSGQPTGFRGILRDVTERVTTLRELRDSEHVFRLMAENTGQLIYDYDLDSGRVRWAGAVQAMLGVRSRDADAIDVHAWLDRIHPDDRERCRSLLAQCNLKGERFQIEYRLRTGEDRYLPVSESGAYLFDAQGKPWRMIGSIADVTERKQQEQALRHEKEQAQTTLGAIGDAVVRLDADCRIVYLNRSAERMGGFAEADILGVPVTEVLHFRCDDDDNCLETMLQRCLAGERVERLPGEVRLRRPHGEEIEIAFSAAAIGALATDAVGIVLIFSDISQEVRSRRELAYQASHDALTGLSNRYRFESEANRLIEDARESARVHTLLYMDLDQFKIVNDTCGHHAGDELLRRLTERIGTRVRRNDLLARLGGDEFGLLLANCHPAYAMKIANKVIQTVNEFQFVWEDQSFNVGISIGMVAIDGELSSIELLKAADQACYVAKDQGRNRFHIYASDDHDFMRHRNELQAAAAIDDAIRENRLVLYRQNIVAVADAQGGQHCEILLRMRDRDGEMIAPGKFIPGAERYNKMPAIDRWVVRQTFENVARLAAAGKLASSDRFSINLSGQTINDAGFQDYVRELLDITGLDASNICFEITESSAITNFTTAVQFLESVRALGCRIMLDDFGSGLSSFTYLKRLPIDYLKIDGGLIRDIADSEFDLAIVSAIIKVAEVIGVPVIAEHVETEAVLGCLREIGVQYAQGFLTHCPEPWIIPGETAPE